MEGPKKITIRKIFYRKLIGFLFIGLFIVQISCNFLLGVKQDPVGATLSALYAQQTMLFETLQVFTEVARKGDSTQIAQSTLDASLMTATAQVELLSTLSTQPEASQTPIPQRQIEERLLKSARILLFEDMSASRYIRIVKEALDSENYFYQDVGSAKGWFKSQLLSNQGWDLIIAAAEADREFGGEFFEYIDLRVDQGAAAIIENWDIDLAPSGKAGQLLRRCGVKFESDWYEPHLRVFYWLQPDHPIFHIPYSIPATMRNSQRIWTGDVGDLLQVDPGASGNEGGDPLLLAGTNPSIDDRHGVLVSCLDGRMILQTFRTHEYHHDDMLMLWKNYIHNVLVSYFLQSGRTIPTPAATAQPNQAVTPTFPGPTPGPEYIIEHGCDGIFKLKFTDSPRYQKDLFEHHADGLYVVLRLQYQSLVDFPIMVWDGDYFLEGNLGDRKLSYSLDRDATGYLFIEGSGELVQGEIQPGEIRLVNLAFDIDPKGENWTLVFRPGGEFDGEVCEAKIDLE